MGDRRGSVLLTTHEALVKGYGLNGLAEAPITSHYMDTAYRKALHKGSPTTHRFTRDEWGLDLDGDKNGMTIHQWGLDLELEDVGLTIDKNAAWWRERFPDSFRMLRPED